MNNKIFLAVSLSAAFLLIGVGCQNQTVAPQAPTPSANQPGVVGPGISGSSSAVPPTTQVNTTVPVVPPPPVKPPASVKANVTIQNFSFQPADLQVTSGSTVIWTNLDSVQHIVSLPGTFESSPLNSGDTFQYTFSIPGAYGYHCAIHPSMVGQITVK
ncbi:MAG: plastocyanin/azurin family copper-binding protein [Candidatus Magasanikbacteria bacterium]|nr:plastocyanin/azurin family copper-binding protein [Candidatus Magasanikbacteria bacterium]